MQLLHKKDFEPFNEGISLWYYVRIIRSLKFSILVIISASYLKLLAYFWGWKLFLFVDVRLESTRVKASKRQDELIIIYHVIICIVVNARPSPHHKGPVYKKITCAFTTGTYSISWLIVYGKDNGKSWGFRVHTSTSKMKVSRNKLTIINIHTIIRNRWVAFSFLAH